MEYNSIQNQRIKEKFVAREVVYCVSILISELGSIDSLDDYDEILNITSQPDYEIAISDAENVHVMYSGHLGGYVWVDRLEHMVSKPFDSKYEACQDYCEENNIDYGNIEAYEHWIVTDYLADKLRDHGEMVGEVMGLTIWGRTCSGQAILLDGVISEICEEMEILEGQKYEWEI